MRTSSKGTRYLIAGAVFISMLFLFVTPAAAQYEENAQAGVSAEKHRTGRISLVNSRSD